MPKTRYVTPKSSMLLITFALTALVSGCTWVKKTPEALNVRTVPVDRVADCKSIGSVTTNTIDSISVVNRSAQTVEKELETLAQNQAAESGADTIVATTKVVNGTRTFAMYKCLN
ncbi:MAG: hypothetical protein ACI9SP_001190 [Arenicella sp.]|jgi:hypothetical protein